MSVVVLGACTGSVDSPNATPSVSNAVTDFRCSGRPPADARPLRRLSHRQYRNVVADVVRRTLPSDQAATLLGSLETLFQERPNDVLFGHSESGQRLFARSDQALSEALVRSDMLIATAIAEAVTAPAWLGPFAGACATDADTGNDPACLDALVERLGQLTHRRPLDEAERAFYRDEVYLDGDVVVPEGVADLVQVMLRQPSFVFHVEGGDGELTPHEAASRLAFHFWNTMPDDALFAAAEDGSLMTSEGWDAQVQRVLDDPRAADWVTEFLSEWLRVDRTVPVSFGTGNALDALRGDLALNAALDRASQAEIRELFQYVLASGGSFEDFFLSEVTLTDSDELAALYGLDAPSDGVTPVAVPPERVGILSRAAMLLPRSDITPPGAGPRTHPILRGVFIQRQIMCSRIDPPPANAMNNLPDVDSATTSSRQEAEILTSGGTCRGCHQVLNPPGFVFEVFDAIGQHRSAERLFDRDGNDTTQVPVDSAVMISQLGEFVTGPQELTQVIFESETAGACFARHYARYTLGREEDVREDGCFLRAVDELIDAGAPLRDVISMPLLDPTYRVRDVD
ncbi:MAG: DUF1592 domain-containing protein [Polyangiales bacterium]